MTISNERLQELANNRAVHGTEGMSMARELLKYRRSATCTRCGEPCGYDLEGVGIVCAVCIDPKARTSSEIGTTREGTHDEKQTASQTTRVRVASTSTSGGGSEEPRPPSGEFDEWDDKPDQWTAEIEKAFPTRSESHDEYATAMQMVSTRRSKRSLVALVNWLLVSARTVREAGRVEGWDAAVKRLSDAKTGFDLPERKLRGLANWLAARRPKT